MTDGCTRPQDRGTEDELGLARRLRTYTRIGVVAQAGTGLHTSKAGVCSAGGGGAARPDAVAAEAVAATRRDAAAQPLHALLQGVVVQAAAGNGLWGGLPRLRPPPPEGRRPCTAPAHRGCGVRQIERG